MKNCEEQGEDISANPKPADSLMDLFAPPPALSPSARRRHDNILNNSNLPSQEEKATTTTRKEDDVPEQIFITTTPTTRVPDGALLLRDLFTQPLPERVPMERQTTVKRAGGLFRDDNHHEQTALLQQGATTPYDTTTFAARVPDGSLFLRDMFTQPPPERVPMERQTTVKRAGGLFRDDNHDEQAALLHERATTLYDTAKFVPIKDDNGDRVLLEEASKKEHNEKQAAKCKTLSNWVSTFARNNLQSSTFVGAFMFLLYQIVFCLAMASAIIRPRSTRPILGVMAKMSAVGILFAGPFYIYRLGQDVPAIYPSIDLFLAPFLARGAVFIDNALAAEQGEVPANDDGVFFACFAVLASFGMLLSGILLNLAATFKLANLGTYLPYPVLCGFFSSVGVLLWALAFSVDSNGKTWQSVFFSGDSHLIWVSCVHHAPSLAVGILMNRLGPKHPFYVIFLILCTLTTFYTVMWATGTTLEAAQRAEWFWSREELVYQSEVKFGFDSWAPPAPFGVLRVLFDGTVHWSATFKGLGDMVAMAFLYLLRSSIHANALKKNIGNLVRKVPIAVASTAAADGGEPAAGDGNILIFSGGGDKSFSDTKTWASRFSRSFRMASVNLGITTSSPPRVTRQDSESVDIEVDPSNHQSEMQEEQQEVQMNKEIRPRRTRRTLEEIFIEYGYALFVVTLSGGFGVCPTIATSNTMYAMGAEGVAPQYGSVLLLVVFYLTDFQLVQYIPKAAFSSLLVLGAVDTFVVWFFVSFRKTQDILEWLVVPLIVVFSLLVGFLNAIFLGIGISSFVFVASFFRVGVVKYNASGLEIRSTIERSPASADWLDTHGDYIQVLVLQNYLFFGNASSILNYISTMFEEFDEFEMQNLSYSPPPKPKALIIDMSLTTGMDTSTVDIFADIKELCSNNGCKLYLCGLSSRLRAGLGLGGIKPDIKRVGSERLVCFFHDLDTALGKAEDLLTIEFEEVIKDDGSQQHSPTVLFDSGIDGGSDNGFGFALAQIDAQHGTEFAVGLMDLQPFTIPIELEKGEQLYECDGDVDVVQDCPRGLFFIESGMLKIERDASDTLTRGRRGGSMTQSSSVLTLSKLHARMGSIGRKGAAMKTSAHDGGRRLQTQNFRLARIGPGWVVGTIEISSGLRNPGVHVAVSNCRLHHLPFEKIDEIEKENPLLVLRLYKMLSRLTSHRQEITIDQLATMKSIMSSPAHSKPLSRAALRAFS